MRLRFGKSWFRARKRFTEEWESAKALEAHMNRQAYVAKVEGDGEGLCCFVEFNNDYVGIGFLDEELREFLSYQFQELEQDRLFLTMATHREFEGTSDTVRKGTSYYFKPNGQVTIESEDFEASRVTTRTTEADVSHNWDNYPKFGEYESILRTERM